MVDLNSYLFENEKDLTVYETSFLGLSPGELIFFDYEGSSRFGLVVKSKRTSSGMFLSSKNNTLLNVFLMDSISNPMFGVMINTLYRDKVRCTYTNTPKILGTILGNSFRTFNVAKIKNILRINID